MRVGLKRVGCLAALLAVFVSGGGHWALLQSVAWARMIVSYSRTDTLSTAVSKTFDGEHPCPMCRKIKADRETEQQERQPLPGTSIARVVVDLMSVPAAAAIPFVPQDAFQPTAADFLSPDELAWQPPTPPPRSLHRA